MKIADLKLLLRLRRHRADAAERALAQAKLFWDNQMAQRDRLSVTLGQAEEVQLKHRAKVKSAGADGPVALGHVLALLSISHQQRIACLAQRRQLQNAIDACGAAEKACRTSTADHRHLHHAALKVEHILQHRVKRDRRRRGLEAESAGEEDFRALSASQVRPSDDA